MTAQIFLKTALFKGRDRDLARPVYEIHGTIEHHNGGLDVTEITTLLDGKGKEVPAPSWNRVFLPMSKVDHYIPTEA
ncbi:MAG: hypothetical protein GY898_27585 [Proteobacteria bacterium]|nr:hypothetical protein [Pseudomonadota bacterium]